MRRLLLIAALGVLALPASAEAVLLGVVGDKSRLRSQTGQVSDIRMKFTTWNTHLGYPAGMDRFFTENTPIPMVTLHTKNTYGKEAITPRGIARGYGDRYLVQISKAAHRFGRNSYIRPLAEMNGHWNFYCAYNKSGSYRGESHSTANFRRAFRRIYLIMHGGTHADIDTRLANLGLPRLRNVYGDIPENPFVKILWNPQGFGSPKLAKNSANSYYPGDAYVDVVGNDLYDIGGKAEWAANERLYRAHPSKPYAFPEWGLWALDDPAFVRRMGGWARTHRRLELLAWYESKAGSIFDLGDKPGSRAAYRRYITPLGS
jgi:hypothetical protein